MVLNGLPSWLARPHPMDDLHMAVPAAASAQAGELFWIVERDVLPSDRAETTPSRDSGFRTGRRAEGCLAHFVSLADATDETITNFAREWGVLGFCQEHRLPGIHGGCPPRGTILSDVEGEALMAELSGTAATAGREARVRQPGDWSARFFLLRDSIDDWRGLARQLRSIQLAAYALGEGQPVRRPDWESALRDQSPDLREFLFLKGPGSALGAVITRLLRQAEIKSHIEWDEEQGRFTLAMRPSASGISLSSDSFVWPVGSLFQVLIAQLVASVTLGEQVLCKWCDAAFDWTEGGMYQRSPRSDRGAYCTPFHREEARRDQKAAWKRNRARELKQKMKEGEDDG